MTGRITLKRGIKRAAGWASVLVSPLAVAAGAPRACIFMYHRTTRIGFIDQRTDDWNVAPDVFERHMRVLAEVADVVPLHALPARLGLIGVDADRIPHAATRPLVCVTLDDGYGSAWKTAVPILSCYGIPATLFVPTAYVGGREPMPFDRWGRLNCGRVDRESWRPIGWRELERTVRTGLVSIGSHSCRHLEARDCGARHLAEEAARSRETLRARLGSDQARAYAYPFGSSRLGDVPADYEHAVRAAGYELAVTTDLGLATAASNPFRLPRIEAHQVDSARVLRAKLHGSIAPYWLTDRLRSALH
jgi:peptidoglycan/xylan/chitin deacetylase (PgdA/CDA1 family)